jgi:hypothetical protein
VNVKPRQSGGPGPLEVVAPWWRGGGGGEEEKESNRKFKILQPTRFNFGITNIYEQTFVLGLRHEIVQH